MKRVLSLVIALIMLFGILTACSTDDKKPRDTAGTTADTSAESEEVTDDLPKMDFDGAVFYVLTGLHGAATTHSFYMEDSTDTLEVAYFKRNTEVASRFNVDFYEDDTGNCLSLETIRENVDSGDDSINMYMLWDRYALAAAEENLLRSVDDLQYVNLSKPYWAKEINDSLSINGKQFFIVGDENPVLLSSCTALFYNKGMGADLGLTNPAEYVKNGTWTLENFFGMARKAAADNGDGELDDNDVFGVVLNANQYYNALWMSSDFFIINKDKNDTPYLAISGNAAFADFYDKILNYTHSEDRIALDIINSDIPFTKDYSSAADRYEKALHVFGNGNALFAACAVSRANVMRGYYLDYSILPFPTLNEKKAGDSYCGTIGALVPYVIPACSSDKDVTMASVLLEALACAGRKYVNPAYYDVVLGQKEARGDLESIEMLDMMFSHRVIDLAEVYWNDDTKFLANDCASHGIPFAANLAANEKLINSDIETALYFFDQLD